MSNVEFMFRGILTSIQCKNDDLMQKICEKYTKKLSLDINTLFFIYNGNKINLQLKYSDIINQTDKARNCMSILVNSFNSNNENNEDIIRSIYPICPICKENARIQIQDYKINIFGCKNGHKINNLLIDEYKNSQKIDIIQIRCDVCKLNNKSNTFNNEIYICNLCKANLCPICKAKHDKKHNIINYELKNFTCKIHNELYYSYCKNCNENLCILCEKNHNNHETISYGKIIPNENELRNKLNEINNIITIFNNDIFEIINKLNKVINSIQFIYNINNDFFKNFNVKKVNFQILQNINEINKNLNINDIIKINEDNSIITKLEKIFNIYNKIKDKNQIIESNINYFKDSLIIKDKNDSKMIKNWIDSNRDIYFQLLYRATRDGDSFNNFHSKCNDAPNISLIKLENGMIIGGYTTIPWKSEDKAYISDKEAFIFSVNSKEKYNLKKELNGNYAVYHNTSNYCCCYGYYGDDLAVKEKFLNKNVSYCCGNGEYKSYDTTNFKMVGKDEKGIVKFTISELEIYKVILKDSFTLKNVIIDNNKMIDSMIIKNNNELKMIKNWIKPNEKINFELLFRATRDGDSSKDFYSKCENSSPTISIIKINNGRIIGGYTAIPWKLEDNSFISDQNTFIFSLDSKEKYNLKQSLKGQYAIYHSTNNLYCCCFGYCGDDLAVGNGFLKGNNSYCCGNGDTYYSFETDNYKMIGDETKGKISFKIDELEVYKVSF